MNLESLGPQVQPKHVLVVVPSTENPDYLLKAVADEGHIPLICHSFAEAQEIVKCENIQIIICHDRLPKKCIEEILELARRIMGQMAVIVASRTGEWDEFLEALQQGAFDYLALPPRPSEIKRVLQLARAEVARPQVGSALAVSLQESSMQPSGHSTEGCPSESSVPHYAAAANN